jgi:acylphosphatase
MPGPDSRVRIEATITGRVQGVGFRFFVLRHAAALQLSGWVANEADGSVRCVAEGDRASVERLLEWLRKGPPGARVDVVNASWLPPMGGLDGFDVRPSGHRGD